MKQITPEYLPEVISKLIEQIAEDKASRLKTLSRATVVMMLAPEWVRAEEANALFGLPQNQLYDYARSGKVCAKKTDRMNRNSAVIFRTEDIRKVIEHLEDYSTWAAKRPDINTLS